MASGIHSLITRLISPLARPIRYWTVVELITLKSAWFVGCSRFLRLIRWRLFLSPFLRVSYVCTRTSWWKTLQTLLTKKSAGCYTGKSRFWFPTLILSFSARSWGGNRFSARLYGAWSDGKVIAGDTADPQPTSGFTNAVGNQAFGKRSSHSVDKKRI